MSCRLQHSTCECISTALNHDKTQTMSGPPSLSLSLSLSLFLFIALSKSLSSCTLLLSQSTMSATMQPTRSLCSSHHSLLSLSLTPSLSLCLSLSPLNSHLLLCLSLFLFPFSPALSLGEVDDLLSYSHWAVGGPFSFDLSLSLLRLFGFASASAPLFVSHPPPWS